MKLLDLFAGRIGWSSAFLARGWDVVAIDLVMPSMEIPPGVDYRLMDILTLTPAMVAEIAPDFICASSPCEQFSVHGMKHFHPNPPYPELGLKLFNHTRMLCETSGVPYVMENVRAAQGFVGNAAHHCGPFYLWGSGVPALLPGRGISKGIDVGSSKAVKNMDKGERRVYRAQFTWNQAWSNSARRRRDTAKAATTPPELSACVCAYAERLIEQRHAVNRAP